MDWAGVQGMNPKTFTCGYCGNVVASDRGYRRQSTDAKGVYLCPFCDRPSYISDNIQMPGVAPGSEVKHLPVEVEALYREARDCVAVASYTSAVLTCRKILMHIAVEQKAEAGKSFLHYVDYLAQQGFIPPNGRGWVDHIRLKGNEANHDIVVMSQPDADELISFTEMLLKFIYEFPNKVPAAKAQQSSAQS